MRDFLHIGAAPPCEECVPVTAGRDAMIAECKRYIELLRLVLGPEPDGAKLFPLGAEHEFGTYYEVVCYYDPNKQASVDYAFRAEGEGPKTWNDSPLYGILEPLTL